MPIVQPSSLEQLRALTLAPFYHQAFLLQEELPGKQGFMPWGTKAGKTTAMVMRMVRLLWEKKDRQYRWVAPTYGLSNIGEKRVLKAMPKVPGVQHWKADRVISGPQGSTLQFCSAENPDHLPGEDIAGAVIDEAPRCKEDAFNQILSTTLATDGWLCAIGTPKGRNWFYKHVKQAMRGHAVAHGVTYNPESDTWYKHFPSTINPAVTDRNIRQFKEVTTEIVYRQLVLAEFVDDSAGVFPNLRPCTVAWEPLEPMPERIYIIGADLALKQDYTVITVWDVELGMLVYWERFNNTDSIVVEDRIHANFKRWNEAIVYIDRGGLGESITMNLHRRGVAMGYGPDGNPGIHFTAQNKPAMVHTWNLALERCEPILPPESVWPEFHREHQDYEYAITKQGKWTFAATEGQHDDIVASCLLGWYGLTSTRFSGSVWVI